MRWIVDFLLLISLAALLAGGYWYHQYSSGERASFDGLQENVRRIQQQVALHAATEEVPRNNWGFPLEIDPAWFGNDIPVNPLLPPGHEWIEIASEADYDLDHPRKVVADTPSIAGFWYNPKTGVVRARVPYLVSDQGTLQAYNRVNESHLKDLFATTPPAVIKRDSDGQVRADTAGP